MSDSILDFFIVTFSVFSMFCKRLLNKKKDESRRIDVISDKAFSVVLDLFNEKNNSDTWKAKLLDFKFVQAIKKALADYALTASQIRQLFKYTYTSYGDDELKRYFGWHAALREVVDISEEVANKPVPPLPELPLMDEKTFKVFESEFFVGNISEIPSVFQGYAFSFTLEQRASVLSKMKDGQGVDRTKAREMVRRFMQIHKQSK